MNKTRGVVHINMDGWRKIEKNGATTLYIRFVRKFIKNMSHLFDKLDSLYNFVYPLNTII